MSAMLFTMDLVAWNFALLNDMILTEPVCYELSQPARQAAAVRH
jgi:hypothetical protein